MENMQIKENFKVWQLIRLYWSSVLEYSSRSTHGFLFAPEECGVWMSVWHGRAGGVGHPQLLSWTLFSRGLSVSESIL